MSVKRYMSKKNLAAALLLGMASGPALACTSEEYIGSVCYVVTSWCPRGYVPADGQTLSITQYQALYSLVGTNYGGNGTTTFGVPDLRGRAPIHAGNLTINASGNTAASNETFTVGQKVGAAAINLSNTQMPSHTHAITLSGTQTVPGVTAPVTGTLTDGTVSVDTANTTVSGSVKLGTTNTAGRTATIAAKSALTTPGGAAAQLYTTSTTPDLQLGADNAVQGTLGGTTSAALTNKSVTGSAVVPGQTVAGTLVATAAATPAPTESVAVRNPGQVVTACVAVEGLYPPRP